MLDENLIEAEETEIYQYGLHLLFLKTLHLCSILLLGLLMGKELEIFLFTICYSLLRSYTGGFHAKRSLSCYAISMLMVFLIIWTSDFIVDKVFVIVTCLSAGFIYILCPNISKEKPLERDEIERNRKISIIITATLLFLFFIFHFFDIKNLYSAIAYSLFFCSLYLIIPIIYTYRKE